MPPQPAPVRPGALDTRQDFEETKESKIVENEVFGYWKVTVERPLRLAVGLGEEQWEEFREACVAAEEQDLPEVADALGERLGAGPHLDFNAFLEEAKGEVRRRGGRVTATRRKLMRTGLGRRDQAAEPVVKRVHRDDVPVGPIRGLFGARLNDKRQFVEYEPDTGLRDTEQIALTEEDGIKGFLRREVLPYAEDASLRPPWRAWTSWQAGTFRHMVNLRRIHLYNAVNRRMGHGPLDIRTPREVGNDE